MCGLCVKIVRFCSRLVIYIQCMQSQGVVSTTECNSVSYSQLLYSLAWHCSTLHIFQQQLLLLFLYLSMFSVWQNVQIKHLQKQYKTL